ncbi:hypothetical protein [Bacillus paramycoides]|uniref:hypothetical protein n=1 Tax=Bacillus paramycoides TaxID=2026194 RepID=UPI002E1E1FF6|nr:hypothetical protein [Bacillus paramycoides]
MSNFDFLKQYVVSPGMEVSSDVMCVFYPIEENIDLIKKEWGREFPIEETLFSNKKVCP